MTDPVKTSEAQRRANRKQDAKRRGQGVFVRLDPAEMKALDKARGRQSRGGFIKAVLLEALQSGKS